MSTEISPIIRFLYSKLLKKDPFIGAFFVPLHYNEKDSNGQKESARSLISELFAYLCGCLPKGSIDFIYWEV